MDWLFSLNPGPYFPLYKMAILVFSLLIVGAVALYVYLKTQKINSVIKSTLRPVPLWLLSFGIAGYALVFFRLGGIPYLSMRFLFLVLLGCFLWYMYSFVQYMRTEVPKRMERVEKRSLEKKYAHHTVKKKKKK